MPKTELLASLDLFWTELSPARAVVYARLSDIDYQEGWRLSGYVRGPRSTRTQTLPATIPLVDLGAGPTHLARAVVPDPSYWSPESPNIYDVLIELHRPGLPTVKEMRQLGFRPIRGSERYLLREGKPWVPRGVLRAPGVPDFSIATGRDEALVAALPNAEWAKASNDGLYVITQVGGSLDHVKRSLREFSRWPAIFMAIINLDDPTAQVSKDGLNLLLGQAWGGDEQAIHAWADAVIVETPLYAIDHLPAALNKPVLVAETLDRSLNMAEIRGACDALQRKLAPLGQFAGYFVSPESS